MTVFETLDIVRDGAISHLWLNRPEKLNPLSTQVLEELACAAAQLNSERDVRVVIVGGRGRAFSAGADLSSFGGDSAMAREAADAGRLMADAIEGLRAVSIARLHGWCVGGGLVLAAACDLRIAASDARFSIPEVDLGIPLAWGGIPRLVREIGPALTKELVMTCRAFEAQEALRAGFLNKVVEPAALDDAVGELATEVARRPRFPIEATKRHVDAITAAAIGLDRSWADADGLLTGLADPECAAAREAYLGNRR